MPRPNQPRSIEKEANVAERIALERERRGLSYEALAKQMTEQGCSMAGSAIFRIEKGEPRRHITVDELVAFAKVFDTTEEDLLQPVERIRTKRGQELAEELFQVWEELPENVYRLTEIVAEMYELSESDPELHEFVENQFLSQGANLTFHNFAPAVIGRLEALVREVFAIHFAPGAHPAKMPVRQRSDGRVRG